MVSKIAQTLCSFKNHTDPDVTVNLGCRTELRARAHLHTYFCCEQTSYITCLFAVACLGQSGKYFNEVFCENAPKSKWYKEKRAG